MTFRKEGAKFLFVSFLVGMAIWVSIGEVHWLSGGGIVLAALGAVYGLGLHAVH